MNKLSNDFKLRPNHYSHDVHGGNLIGLNGVDAEKEVGVAHLPTRKWGHRPKKGVKGVKHGKYVFQNVFTYHSLVAFTIT